MSKTAYSPLRLVACFIFVGLGLGCSKEATTTRSLERGRAFLAAGEHEKAKIEFMSIIQKEPSNAEAYSQVGLIWSLQGSGLQAVKNLNRAKELGDLSVPLRVRLAQGLMGAFAMTKAREEAVGILQKDPANAEALVLLADASRTAEELEEARRAIDQFPDKNAALFHLSSVSILLKEGNDLAAEEAVNRALAADPKVVAVHLAAAHLRKRRQDFNGAAESYRTASELAPVRSNERLEYGGFLAERGKVEEARKLVADVLTQAPDFVPALVMSAQLALSVRDFDMAMAQLDKAFAIDADNLGGRLLQADVWLAKNEPEKGVEILQRLSDMFRGAPMVRVRLARAKLAERDLAGAALILDELQVAFPGNVEVALLLAEVNLRRGNAAAVIPAMKALLEKPPTPEAVAIYLAQAYEIENRLPEAVQVVQAMIEQQPGEVRHYRGLAELLGRSGQTAEARAAYEKVLELAPDDTAALTRLVDMDLAAKQFEAAQKRVESLRAKAPQSALASLLEATIAIAQKDLVRAEAALVKSLEADPANAEAHDLMVRLYASTDRRAKAVEKLTEMLAKNPNDARALRQVGILYSEEGDFAKAAEAYEKLIAVLPSPEAFVLNNLAVVYAVHLKQPDRAFEFAQQARALRPSVGTTVSAAAKLEAAAIADTLGWLRYGRGEYALAFPLIQEAAGHFTDNAEVQYHYGMAAAAMGENETARQALTIAAAAATAFPGQEEAKKHLALLGDAQGVTTPSAEISALLAKEPGHLVLQLRLAEALEREKNVAEAAAAYAAVFTKNPSLLVAAQKLAHLYAGPLKSPEKALEYAKSARQLAPNDPKVASLLGDLSLQAGDHLFAYNLLREATRVEPRDPATLATFARAAYSIGKVEEARTAMQEALTAAPAAAFAAEAATFLALTAPEPAGTPAAAEQALQQDPRSVPALMVRAAVQTEKKDLPAAVATYEAALAIYPAFVPAQSKLSLLLAADPATRDRAFELATQARKELPNDADLAEVMGQLASRRKDHRLAVQLLTEAGQTKPPGAGALFALGVSQAALGTEEAARESLTKAVAAGLPEADAAEAAALLGELKE